MKREYIINIQNFLKSELDIVDYFILQVIWEKDVDLFDDLKIKLDYLQELDVLIRTEYIKYTGSNFDKDAIDPDSLDIVDFILLERATEIFNTDDLSKKLHEVDTWIQDYRNLFKGIKIGSQGDKNACTLKMKKFMKDNPTYSKEHIFNVTKSYIDTTEPTFTMQADYFIYKTGSDKIVTSRLGMYCEMKDIKVEKPMKINKMI